MNTLPYAALPLSAGGAPVPGVSMVPHPPYPTGVSPTITQYPAAPAFWPGTHGYPGSQPWAAAPQGTYRLTPSQGPASMGAPGVSLTPVQSITPPAPPGGPHPLLQPPGLPVPQGFPNPFDIQQVTVSPAAQPGPLPPGSTAVTGPRGYHPGLGYLGTPPPFWVHLAWQLIQSPEVRKAVGDQLETLLKDELQNRTLSVAVGLLLERELQDAFRALVGGILEKSRFLELFGSRLKTALTAAGMLA